MSSGAGGAQGVRGWRSHVEGPAPSHAATVTVPWPLGSGCRQGRATTCPAPSLCLAHAPPSRPQPLTAPWPPALCRPSHRHPQVTASAGWHTRWGGGASTGREAFVTAGECRAAADLRGHPHSSWDLGSVWKVKLQSQRNHLSVLRSPGSTRVQGDGEAGRSEGRCRPEPCRSVCPGLAGAVALALPRDRGRTSVPCAGMSSDVCFRLPASGIWEGGSSNLP